MVLPHILVTVATTGQYHQYNIHGYLTVNIQCNEVNTMHYTIYGWKFWKYNFQWNKF